MRHTKPLGLPACVSLIVGNMIGSGIFLLPASLAAIGSISLFGWVATATGSLMLALTFGLLSERLPYSGGPYVYCRASLGDFAGYQVSLAYIFANIIGDAATTVAFLAYASSFWPVLKTDPVLAFSLGTAVIWFIAALNIWGVRKVKVVQITTTLCKLTPIIMVAVVGSFHMSKDNLAVFNISGQPHIIAIANAAMLTLFAFAGLESSTVPAEHIDNPSVTIKRATIIATFIASVIYIASTTALIGMISPIKLASSTAPFADAGRIIFGDWAYNIFAIAGMVSCFSATLGFLFITGQTTMTVANDGLLPEILAKRNRRNMPVYAYLATALIMTGVLSLNYTKHLTEQFTLLITLSDFFILIPYLYTSIAAMRLFKRNEKGFWTALFVAVLACIYSLFAMIGSGRDGLYYGLLLLLALSPFYAFTRKTTLPLSESNQQ